MAKKVNANYALEYYKKHWFKTKEREDKARELLKKVLKQFDLEKGASYDSQKETLEYEILKFLKG